MGVGEDESLGEAVAVTIIATGFNVEQQNEIVNTEPKKIIHSLEDEQKLTHNLSQKVIESFDFSAPIPSAKNEEKIVHDLMEEEPIFEQPLMVEAVTEQPLFDIPLFTEPVAKEEPAFEYNLVPTTEFIKNLDVTFEIVSPASTVKAVSTDDFYFTSPEVKEIEVREPVFVREEEQITFSFDLPISKVEKPNEDRMLFDLTNETREIKVNQPVQVVPMTELNENGVIRYSLEEYMEVENSLLDSKPVAKVAEPESEDLKITMKITEPSSFGTHYEAISPTEMSLEEASRLRADERRRKLKEFNYKFHNNPSRVDEFEKEPAYKRLGIDISSTPANNNKSRTSLGMDSNDDIQLRSNNSFLHDNVD